MPRFRIWTAWFALALLIAPALFFYSLARASGSEQASPPPHGIYHAPLLNNPPTLDPAYVQDMYGVAVVQQLFDGLVRFSPDLFVVPALAESWQVEEGGRLYRFRLRENATFHNGRRVTAPDVVFSISRLLRATPASPIQPHLAKISGARDYIENRSERVTGLQALDERTVLIRLDEPYAPFLIALGMYQAKIVPAEEVNRTDREFGKHPVGTGPFRFVSWEENARIRLEAFPGYYAGAPRLERIEFVIYPGGGIDAVLKDFLAGQLEEMPVYGQIRQPLSEQKGLQWVHRPSLSLLFYGINCENPRLRNPAVRRALSEAIDREALVREVYNGQFEPAQSLLPPGLPGYQPRTQKLSTDSAAAAAQLKAALGEGGSLGTVEVVSSVQSALSQAELKFVSEAWAKIGVSMQPKFITDWGQFEKYLRTDAVELYRYVWFADMPDPDNILQPLFASEAPANFMRFRNPEVERMLQSALALVDPLERAATYTRAEDAILGTTPAIPLFYLSIDFVYQPAVEGVQVSALGAHTMSYHRVALKAAGGQ